MSGKKQKKSVKKNSKKTKNQPVLQIPSVIMDWITLGISLMMLGGLLSFAYGTSGENWLGLIGYSSGWILTALFGLSSYILVLYSAWFSWRRALNKTINYPILKHFIIGMLIISTSMLLCAFENAFPKATDTLTHYFYTQLWYKKIHFHLGGAPFYYVYKDLPGFNLYRLVGNIGVTIIFTSTLILSILLLSKTSISQIKEKIKELLEYISIVRPPEDSTQEDQTQKNQTKILKKGDLPLDKSDHPPSDPLRFVKVKIPNFSQEKNPFDKGNDLLEINPEKNLFVRPSISMKEIKKNFGEPRNINANTNTNANPHHINTFGANSLNTDNIHNNETEKAKNKSNFDPDIKTEIKMSTPMTTSNSTSTKMAPAPTKREAAISAQKVHNGDFSDYKVPNLNLLTSPKQVDQSSLKQDLRCQAEVLEETLLSFGIEAKVGQINCGPTITSFEVHPAIGVKVQKIKALENDIALNMEAKSIRILAPIPGKAAIGIEVPNAQPQEVAFKDMLASYRQKGKKYFIPVLLGKTVNGDYVTEDLTKMPHVIIAGATGSGKSVCINTIVMSILMTAKPDEIKLIMVDPKKVELTPYTRLPHMLAPVITEPIGACAALGWLVKEMENRYDILKLVALRNISSFNSRKIDKEFEASLAKEIPEKMPYIVCIIDELADLMMVASNDIETYIARIAQMARAVGIHLILATQRPSREVITGLIKANFPTRISFKVSSRINSQIILDEIGAEMLLGNGDMLFLPPGAHHLMRAQGAYIRDEDINNVIQQICDQAPPNYLIQSFDRMTEIAGDLFSMSADKKIDEKDSLYDEALETILSTGNASTTFLQRKLKVGYARAASIIDQLEANGIIGPADGSKARQILVQKDI